ncbi:unnamed protein product [Camellia sinensis]
MDAEDCEDSNGLPPFQPAAHSEHTVDGCVVSVEQTPTAGNENSEQVARGSGKNGSTREFRSWRVVRKTLRHQLNHNTTRSESIMITHIRRRR